MPKSTAMPTKRAANATEIRLSRPTVSAAKPAVVARPAARVASSRRTSCTERNPTSSRSRTPPSAIAVVSPAPLRREANSSSESGTGPVSWTRTPRSGVRPSSRAACRIASLALAPGSSAPKSSTGRIRMMRWSSCAPGGVPVSSVLHAGGCGCGLASVARLFPTARKAGTSGPMSACPPAAPSRASPSAPARPRRLGSDERRPSSGCASTSFWLRSLSSSSERNRRPYWRK